MHRLFDQAILYELISPIVRFKKSIMVHDGGMMHSPTTEPHVPQWNQSPLHHATYPRGAGKHIDMACLTETMGMRTSTSMTGGCTHCSRMSCAMRSPCFTTSMQK